MTVAPFLGRRWWIIGASDGLGAALARAMANPLYYFDLDAIGRLGQTTLRQPGTRYVKVFDAQGRIVSCLEGGYNLNALARSVEAHVRVLADL